MPLTSANQGSWMSWSAIAGERVWIRLADDESEIMA
jgi:hypothetical protein